MTEGTLIVGLAASPGHRRGRARVRPDVTDLSGIAPGEILVTRFASPELVLAFDQIGAFVTDQGGWSAHASVVAREFGVPGVVGTQVATEQIADGSVVLVDGEAGTVHIETIG